VQDHDESPLITECWQDRPGAADGGTFEYRVSVIPNLGRRAPESPQWRNHRHQPGVRDHSESRSAEDPFARKRCTALPFVK
jgi:hypothetical protein